MASNHCRLSHIRVKPTNESSILLGRLKRSRTRRAIPAVLHKRIHHRCLAHSASYRFYSPILIVAAFKSTISTPVSNSVMAAAATSPMSCNWTVAAQVVGQIQADKLNVTDIVAQCANVCQVAFNSTSAAGVSIFQIIRWHCMTNDLISHLLGKG